MKYTGEATREISFPLGGIGTGSIGLAGNGKLVDWEIFNRPDKGSYNGYTHFAVKAVMPDGRVVAKVLCGDQLTELNGRYGKHYGSGAEEHSMSGFPHFSHWEFTGEFPAATLRFWDEDFPAVVTLTAFSPFLPHNPDDSSLPAAFFEIGFEAKETAEFTAAFSFRTMADFVEVRESRREGYCALSAFDRARGEEEADYRDLTAACDAPETFCQNSWYRGQWKDDIVCFWKDFSSREDLKQRYYPKKQPTRPRHGECSTLAGKCAVKAGQSETMRFVFCWNVPNHVNFWDKELDRPQWKNYYATLFSDSLAAADYCFAHYRRLREGTFRFKAALDECELPSAVVEAARSNLSVLRSAVVLRLSDGSIWGWEGLFEKEGACYGTCQHVYNYAYALCFLFPSLERGIRENEFRYNTTPEGLCFFRLKLPLTECRPAEQFACLDGQMGTVFKTYREFLLSGRTGWLREQWPTVKRLLDYAFSEQNPHAWDRNKDGVLEGRQHHTLDMELFGPSSWLEGMYLAALRAGEEMARRMGDEDAAEEYASLFRRGKEWTKEHLFNGEYFIQQVDLKNKSLLEAFGCADPYWDGEAGEIKYQIGEGCAIDQLLGQYHADLIGLGEIFDPEERQRALDAMWRYLFHPSMRRAANPWRSFCLEDEAGAVMCRYPADRPEPRIPLTYSSECMTGFEYAFAYLLIRYGFEERGLRLVKAVRDRYDGKKRNPYNELECGCNYARSMASFSLLWAYHGMTCDLSRRHMAFAPVREGISSFWSVEGAYGTVSFEGEGWELFVREGALVLESFGVGERRAKGLSVDGVEIPFTQEGERLCFAKREICRQLRVRF